MAGRPKRSVPRVDYRRLSLVGLEADSSEDEGSDKDESIRFESDHEAEELDVVLSSSEEEDEEKVDVSDVFESKNGIKWTSKVPSTPIENWRVEPRDFHAGPQGEARTCPGSEKAKKANVFRLFFTDEILDEVCLWTNKFGKHLVEERNNNNPSKEPLQWNYMDAVEFRGFLGLILLSGVEKTHHKPWSEMWSMKELVRNPAFTACMARRRFLKLMSAMRFDDAVARHERQRLNPRRTPAPRKRKGRQMFTKTARKRTALTPEASEAGPEPSQQPPQQPQPARTETQDKLEPIRQVWEKVTRRFQQLWTPGAKLCVDEQLVKFRGKAPFRVYMPKKPGKYGLKIWALVDNSSNYILKLDVYLGKKDSPEVELGKTVVMNLIQGYGGSFRGVVADNFFSSYSVLKDLLAQKLTFCGTLRINRLEVPPVARNVNLLTRPDAYLFNEEDQVTLFRRVYSPKDFVLIISSAHFGAISVPQDEDGIPEIIDYYNANKGGVDTVDYMISLCSGQFPTKRWTMKIFIHMLDCVTLNSSVIWIHNNPTWKQGTKGRRRLFLRALAYQLIRPQVVARSATAGNLPGYVRSAIRMFGVPYRPIRAMTRKKKPKATQGRCMMCMAVSTKRKRTKRYCRRCHDGICEAHTARFCENCAKDMGYAKAARQAAGPSTSSAA